MPTALTRNANALARKLIATNRCLLSRPTLISVRYLSDNRDETGSVHFRATSTPHPLATKENTLKASKPTISGLDKDGKPIVEVIAIKKTSPNRSLRFLPFNLLHLSSPLVKFLEIIPAFYRITYGRRQNLRRSLRLSITTNHKLLWTT